MAGRVKPYGTFGSSPGTEVDLLGALHITEEDSPNSTSEASAIGKPGVGVNTAYSFERYIRFKVTVAPQNQFTNFKFWSGSVSSPATGVVFKVGTAASYSSPVITKSNIATHLLHSTYPSYSNSLGVTGTLTGVGQTSAYIVIQAHVLSNAASGTVDSTKTLFHLGFDES